MRIRNNYDTAVVFLYATGRENLLPAKFRKSIPYTTISGWRRADCGKYIGHEFRYFFDEAFEKAELISRYQQLKTAFRSFAVMDNFSKMILGFHVMERRTFAVVKKAIQNALKIAMKHPGQKKSNMVADGGTENHNKYIHEFLANLVGYRVTKLRALKDIRFSNSPVEAIHRTIKGRYLKGRKFDTIKSLVKFLNWAVHDYNELRPHYKHRPRTPHEVYFDIPLGFDMEKRKKRAREQRLKTNKCVNCIQCKGIHKQNAIKALLRE